MIGIGSTAAEIFARIALRVGIAAVAAGGALWLVGRAENAEARAEKAEAQAAQLAAALADERAARERLRAALDGYESAAKTAREAKDAREKDLAAVRDAWCDQCVPDAVRLLLGADCGGEEADAGACDFIEELR